MGNDHCLDLLNPRWPKDDVIMAANCHQLASTWPQDGSKVTQKDARNWAMIIALICSTPDGPGKTGGFSEDQLCYAYDMLMLVLALNHFFLAVTAAAATVAAVAAAGHTRTELMSFKGRCHRSHTGAVQRIRPYAMLCLR